MADTKNTNDTLILYVGERNISSWSMRGYLALEHKGVPYEERTISLISDKDRERRRKVSPTGKVPVLHAGEIVVPDSLAIVEFLEEAYPPPGRPALWPANRADRAHARWLAAAMHSGFPKLRESMSFNLCFLPKRPQPTPEAAHEAAEILAHWEAALGRKETRGALRPPVQASGESKHVPQVVVAGSTRDAVEMMDSVDYAAARGPAAGPFLFGPFTAADIMFAPVIVRLRAFGVSTARAPHAEAYMDAVLAHPPVKRWMEAARALPPHESY